MTKRYLRQRLFKFRYSRNRSSLAKGAVVVAITCGVLVSLLSAEVEKLPAISAQEQSGAITLMAKSATTHGNQMHYESSPLKYGLGYWLNVEDWAEWEFKVIRQGVFEVEVWQDCGQGQGGSEVV